MSVFLLLAAASVSGDEATSVVEGTVRAGSDPVRWAFVYVKRASVDLPEVAVHRPVVLRFGKSGITPRVAGVRTGQAVIIKAGETFPHSPHFLPLANRGH